ncbi:MULTISPECIES: GNAT family N-acetyltransferase [Vagococcus]|uniref:Acetyltransferase, GNAT family n=1 Tax=Vagococcus fluvialis bH819 TaxID=1255619 RepID=A0A1X6WR77_9ENTE|nr:MULTISPECIES: GNAT family N-acetyltransferase [Vagococcus]SLM86156.1 acetyltransferase, GNAT family [Vagococcus fluvialis bH819]HCM90404.1 N-acetyltransferase [Vagococcus sp.]
MIKSYKQVSSKERTKIWNESFSGYQTSMSMTEEQLDNRLKHLQLCEDSSFIMYENNKPAGITLYGEKIIKNQKIAWVGGLAVHPNFRKNGIGVLLLNQVENIAKNSGVSTITLEVITENIGALKLYERNGYQAKRKVSVFEGELPTGDNNRLFFKQVENQLINDHVTIPWQNRRNHEHQVFQIEAKNQGIVGEIVCDFDVAADMVIIYQLTLLETKRFKEVLIALKQTFEIKYFKALNLHTDSYEVNLIKEQGFEVMMERYQMEKILSEKIS